MDNLKLLQKAKQGDIRSFHELYSAFQDQLKSYLYRLVTNRNDMEDVAQDVFIIAFENIKTFREEANLKSWVFTIATNHAKRILKDGNRWVPSTQEEVKALAHADPQVMHWLDHANQTAPLGRYEIREHIDYCFTCVTKMLTVEQQVALMLKDIYDFSVKEVTEIANLTEPQAKHLLHQARKKMVDIFDDTCALVGKQGVCHQCSGLNGKYNPKADSQEELMKLKFVKERDTLTKERMLELREELVKTIDPLHGNGADLHEQFFRISTLVNAK